MPAMIARSVASTALFHSRTIATSTPRNGTVTPIRFPIRRLLLICLAFLSLCCRSVPMCNPRPARAYSNPMTKPKRKPTPKGLDHSSLYTGLRDAAEREDRRRLLEDLSRQGATFEMLEAAVREERLSTLPVEFALNDGSRYTLTEVARRANVDPRYVRAVLLSLGHPNPRPRERRFSDRDVEVARILRVFLDAGLPKDEILEVS